MNGLDVIGLNLNFLGYQGLLRKRPCSLGRRIKRLPRRARILLLTRVDTVNLHTGFAYIHVPLPSLPDPLTPRYSCKIKIDPSLCPSHLTQIRYTRGVVSDKTPKSLNECVYRPYKSPYSRCCGCCFGSMPDPMKEVPIYNP